MRFFFVQFGLSLLVNHYLGYCVCPYLNANVQGHDLAADEDNDATNGIRKCNGDGDEEDIEHCCSEKNPCNEGEGDCDVSGECKGDLVCGTDNCDPDKYSQEWVDCCEKDKSKNQTSDPITTQKCGKGGNAQNCGEMCFGDMNTLPGSKEVFYCDKGEKCCPKPPQGEECAKICPTYDKEAQFGDCKSLDDCCQNIDDPCFMECDIEINKCKMAYFFAVELEWINWEPCGQGCGPGMPECPKDEKCQTTDEYDGSPLLCHGKCEKVTSF